MAKNCASLTRLRYCLGGLQALSFDRQAKCARYCVRRLDDFDMPCHNVACGHNYSCCL